MKRKGCKRQLLWPVVALMALLAAASSFGLPFDGNGQGKPAPEVPRSAEGVQLLIDRGEYAKAETLARDVLEAAEKEHGAGSIGVARAVDALLLASLFTANVTAPDIHELARRALEIKERVFGPDHPEVATTLHNHAQLLRAASKIAEALPMFKRAAAIREARLGKDHPDFGKTLSAFAALLYISGDFSGARPMFERALAIQEEALGEDNKDVSATLTNLGSLYMITGEYDRAKETYERSLRTAKKVYGPEHPQVALTLTNLVGLYGTLRDVERARASFERALAIQEKTVGPEHPDVAGSLSNFGAILIEIGDYGNAQKTLARALAIQEKALGQEHPVLGDSLIALAVTHELQGDYEKARGCLERALAISKKALGADHYKVAVVLNDLAGLSAKSGDLTRARQLYEEAQAVYEKNLGPDHYLLANGLNSLAVVLAKTEDADQAHALFERALAIYEKALGPQFPDAAETRNNLSIQLLRMNEPKKALAAALQAEQASREHLRLTARTLTERQALGYAARRASGLDVALSIAAGTGGKEAESQETSRAVWDALIQSRALVLDEMAARNRSIGEADDPETAKLANQLVSARKRLANLVVRGPAGLPAVLFKKMIDEARQEKEKAEQALAEKSAVFRQVKARERIGFTDVAGALPGKSALVAFARYDHYSASTVPSYVALVLREGEKALAVAQLGTAAEIDALVSRWRKEVTRGKLPSNHGDPGQTEGMFEAGAALRRAVWDPIAGHLGDANRVFVVPDGTLHLVNLSALPIEMDRYLVEDGPLVHYLSAERDLVRPTPSGRENAGILAVGDPNFDSTLPFAALAPGKEEAKGGIVSRVASLFSFRGAHAGCGGFGSLRFEALPASAEETSDVIRLWEKHGGKAGERERVLCLTGDQADERAFKRNVPGRRVLHLATHGFFLGGECESALEDTRGFKGMGNVGEEHVAPVTGENPLLLSGLIMAGANHRSAAGPDEEDGILTAEEIASLDLSGVEWAVLSACETGLGEVKAGEGVFGLRRAFQMAGAGTLIMSLWSVEDEATLAWMSALYEARLAKKKDTAQCVRDAGLKILKRRRAKGQSTHPFFWGAFVAAGDWN